MNGMPKFKAPQMPTSNGQALRRPAKIKTINAAKPAKSAKPWSAPKAPKATVLPASRARASAKSKEWRKMFGGSCCSLGGGGGLGGTPSLPGGGGGLGGSPSLPGGGGGGGMTGTPSLPSGGGGGLTGTPVLPSGGGTGTSTPSNPVNITGSCPPGWTRGPDGTCADERG